MLGMMPSSLQCLGGKETWTFNCACISKRRAACLHFRGTGTKLLFLSRMTCLAVATQHTAMVEQASYADDQGACSVCGLRGALLTRGGREGSKHPGGYCLECKEGRKDVSGLPGPLPVTRCQAEMYSGEDGGGEQRRTGVQHPRGEVAH